jgi:hypothetical protein
MKMYSCWESAQMALAQSGSNNSPALQTMVLIGEKLLEKKSKIFRRVFTSDDPPPRLGGGADNRLGIVLTSLKESAWIKIDKAGVITLESHGWRGSMGIRLGEGNVTPSQVRQIFQYRGLKNYF